VNRRILIGGRPSASVLQTILTSTADWPFKESRAILGLSACRFLACQLSPSLPPCPLHALHPASDIAASTIVPMATRLSARPPTARAAILRNRRAKTQAVKSEERVAASQTSSSRGASRYQASVGGVATQQAPGIGCLHACMLGVITSNSWPVT
jgi:hypothetical protein